MLRIKQGPYRAVHILSFISYLEFSIYVISFFKVTEVTSTARKNAETANTSLRRYEHNTSLRRFKINSASSTRHRRNSNINCLDAIGFPSKRTEKPGGASNSSDLKNAFEKFRFHDGYGTPNRRYSVYRDYSMENARVRFLFTS